MEELIIIADNARNNLRKREVVKYPCGQCGKELTSQSFLTEQRRAVHKEVKHSCGQCGKEFTRQGVLAKHRRAVHEGVKYSCVQCGNEYTRPSDFA